MKSLKNIYQLTDTPKLTLNEGHTPLIHCENLSKMLDIDLYVKYEGANPTGSFKDRGMVMAVTKAKEQGKKLLSVHLLVIHRLQECICRTSWIKSNCSYSRG